MKRKYIGKEFKRVDAISKLTGGARFLADIELPHMYHGVFIRAKNAHAEIINIDTKDAEKVEGVKAIVLGRDFHHNYGHLIKDRPIFAFDKVRYYGEAIGGIVARTEEAARVAADRVKVTYNPLPVIVHPKESLERKDVLIRDIVPNDNMVYRPIKGTNIYHYDVVKRGDVEKGFEKADLIVENEFEIASMNHVQIEPHGAIALWDEGGNLTVWSSTQAPFTVRYFLADIFEIPLNKVRVIAYYVGGGFGGKSDVGIEPMVALMAKSVPGHPVKVILSREEVFHGSFLRGNFWGKVKTGVTKDGKIIAEKVEFAMGSGGSGEFAGTVVDGAFKSAVGPYEVENIYAIGYGVYTNLPPTGAFRGYGHPEVHWMIERQRDIIARKLNIDPAMLREKNLLKPGSINAIGQRIEEHNGNLKKCLELVIKELDWPHNTGYIDREKKKAYGKGFALLQKSPVMPTNAASSAILKLNDDGTVNLTVGTQEIGQGIDTALTQIAAEALDIPPEKVKLVPYRDTDTYPYEWQTVASRGVWSVGNAIVMAAEEVKEKMRKVAKRIYNVPEEEIIIENELVYPKGEKNKAISYREIAIGYTFPEGNAIGGPIVGSGYFLPEGIIYPDPETGQGNSAAEWTFGAQGVELEVDLVTGKVNILKAITAIDAGTIINPENARGQVVGAMAMALSMAQREALIISEDGKIRNDGLTDYKISTVRDVPFEYKVFFVETEEETGPFGARSLAEHGMVGMAPAFANALYNALGIDFFKLPITFEDIAKAIDEKKII